MTAQLFLMTLCCFSCFFPTDQEDEDDQPTADVETVLYTDLLYNLLNDTFPTGDGMSFESCSGVVHGLSGWGLSVAYLGVTLLSLLGNSVVIYVVRDMKRGRSTTDVFLMHLAVADLLFSVTLPFWAVRLHSGWIFGVVLCKLLSGLQEASIYSSVLLLASISLDRYFAIVKATQPLSFRRHLVGITCASVWLAAAVLSLAVAVQREVTVHGDRLICYENLAGEGGDRWRVAALVLRHSVGFFLPLSVMVVCYGCTATTLFHARSQNKYKAMRVILAVVLVFVLCWLPHNVTVLMDTLMRGGLLGPETCEMRNRVDAVLYVSQAMAFTHCAVNPVLYAFIGQKFRSQLLLALQRHGLVSKRLRAGSGGSSRSRNTTITL